jgi:transketolase
MKPDEIQDLKSIALRVRQNILNISLNCGEPVHLGGGLSLVEILVLLYKKILNFDPLDPRSPNRDRFILSKGHGVLGFFPVLAEAGIISQEKLKTFKENGSDLIAHPVMNLDLGIESSNGSLGHGLSMAVGICLAARKRGHDFKTYVLMGDGECNEGSVWEAAMSAAQFKLGNLIAIVDNNSLQSDGQTSLIMDDSSLLEKWKSFGWNVQLADGHDFKALYCAMTRNQNLDLPTMVIAKTIKGKGISFMQGNNEWHHNRLTQTSYDKAILELDSQVDA